MTTHERLKAERDILALASSFGPRGHGDNHAAWSRLESYADALIASGWLRREVLDVIEDVYSKNVESLPPAGDDALSNYLSGLTGECSPEGIVRFPGDPEDPREFILYVRGREWMKRNEDVR
ncbi:hypothetical protein ASA1KI_03710 [Opitutales bacterium ASA1]|nr:hypothetical protein ASA1KI_03710 [Opitutales bacterium ASA1]